MNTLNKEEWIKDYEQLLTKECPFCSSDDLEHTCRNCYSEIDKDICWKYKWYCNKCYIYINEEIPRIDKLKKELGVKCECNDPQCSKCLTVWCEDDNCPAHTMDLKIARRRKLLTYINK